MEIEEGTPDAGETPGDACETKHDGIHVYSRWRSSILGGEASHMQSYGLTGDDVGGVGASAETCGYHWETPTIHDKRTYIAEIDLHQVTQAETAAN